jgi:hypothetical protein
MKALATSETNNDEYTCHGMLCLSEKTFVSGRFRSCPLSQQPTTYRFHRDSISVALFRLERVVGPQFAVRPCLEIVLRLPPVSPFVRSSRAGSKPIGMRIEDSSQLLPMTIIRSSNVS